MRQLSDKYSEKLVCFVVWCHEVASKYLYISLHLEFRRYETSSQIPLDLFQLRDQNLTDNKFQIVNDTTELAELHDRPKPHLHLGFTKVLVKVYCV